jgi:GalNAc5-diNAcBac-PP-undecaprenol beta-1,3-glucosyltransferase
MAVATVLIPTHEHGPLIRFSLESALAQTVQDLEVLVVGDGVPAVTREVVGEIARRDARVRFFDNPKGPRHGEIHRHAALAEASGEVVLYLSDDDLWFPEHVETLLTVLRDRDLVSAVALKVHPDGSLKVRIHDVSQHREALLAGGRGIPLSCAAHTMAAYRALPRGWSTTPAGISTDKYMWQQFLADPGCRAGSATRLTVVSLGSAPRSSMRIEERLAETEVWWERVHDPLSRGEIHAQACALMVASFDELKRKQRRAREKIEAIRRSGVTR